jgi:hypothetical protein
VYKAPQDGGLCQGIDVIMSSCKNADLEMQYLVNGGASALLSEKNCAKKNADMCANMVRLPHQVIAL